MLTYPNAKINLGLNIISKREDGYHNLETVFYPIPIYDELEIKESLSPTKKPYNIYLCGQKVTEDVKDNLIVKVFLDLKQEFDLPSIDIYLNKNIPIGAGLGGGSSDAAFTIKAINQEFCLGLSQIEMEKRIAKYGADCAFFIRNKAVYATGIGDKLHNIEFSLSGKYIVLIKPSIFISTSEAYAGITPLPSNNNIIDSLKEEEDNWKYTIKNDFECRLFKMYPELAYIKQTLYDMGAFYASMSGSGSALYGLFNKKIKIENKELKECFIFQALL